MQSGDFVRSNVAKIATLFPQCVTERLNKDGKPELAIDFDKLRSELSDEIFGDSEERYQFTWPEKRKASHLANERTTMTLRPCREESVGKDGTPGGFDSENLYIEGDNLDVLKVIRETYLGKVKMIYIDPPYNTGNDFVYNDDFAVSRDEFEAHSGLFDEEGNQTVDPMVRNTESNGRFHTFWLNMIYPRLKVARDILTDDGVIFISIDDREISNITKLCDEIFGNSNFVCQFTWKSKLGKVGTTSTISAVHEYILCYAKNVDLVNFEMIVKQSDGRKENLRQWGVADRREDRPSMWYPITINGITVYPYKDNGTEGRWRVGEEMAKELLASNALVLGNKDGKYNIYRIFPKSESISAYTTLLLDDIGTTAKGAITLKELKLNKIFDFSKPVELIKHFVFLSKDKQGLYLDFFSGSATTAHAVMQLNSEDGGNRRFIMVQLTEETDKDSEARKAGYKNICEIGKERIRRAGKKIKEEAGLQGQDLDIGFRVLKLDSSNMEDVYYTPEDFDANNIFSSVDNVKPDRTPLDLLFQVMPELNIELSVKIEENKVNGKKVFFVDDSYLIATFDTDVNESTITEIAKMKPQYFVMRDASAANDNVLDNFEQIFRHYSPDTIRRVL
ncbi:site-specific DNA-methyltransferase [Muribaculaceae bacterium Isolate-037 (Harlan)]|nr:site-specific DNA-methyltransferase [Muribaculaceae bacterium Isolate-037 (Harlan)]